MTYRETVPRSWNKPQSGHNDSDDVDDEGACSSRGYSRLGGGKSDTSCMRSNTKISTMSSEPDIHRWCDDDFRLCNSSKATNSVFSLSDQDGSDYDGRTFDYFPPAVKIRSGCGMNLDYDESEDSSTNYINSPRSDLSDRIEMNTFSSRTNVPEEDDDDFINIRRDLNSHQNNFGTDYESDEGTCIKDYYKQDYRQLVRTLESDFQPTFSSQSFLGGSSASNFRRNDVDTRNNFVSLKGDSSHSGRYMRNLRPHRPMSDTVRIEKNMYSNKKDGADHPDKVAQSIDSLISRQPDRDVKNMQEGRKHEPLAPEESKKIKKKKKRLMKGQSADHLDKHEQSVDSLISRQPDRDVNNMQEGRKHEPLAPEESKKIKKKKRRLIKGQSADHLDKHEQSVDSLISRQPEGDMKNMPEKQKLESLTPEESKKIKKKEKCLVKGQLAMTCSETLPKSRNKRQSGHNDSDDDDDEWICTSCGYSPFGRGQSAYHLDKHEQSVDSLISRQPDRDVKNMQEGRKHEPLAPEESKKIKKKKKRLMKGM